MGEQKFGRTITQALDPAVRGRLSLSERWSESWEWLPLKGDVPTGGLIAVCGDVTLGEKWWFVFTDGLYHSADVGKSLKKILAESGKPRLTDFSVGRVVLSHFVYRPETSLRKGHRPEILRVLVSENISI